MSADAAGSSSLTVPELQRQLAKLSDELRARTEAENFALQREEAIADILSVINGAKGDLSVVFGVLIERATKLCSAAYGYVWLYDGERARPAASYAQQPFGEWLRARESIPSEITPLGQTLLHHRVVHVVDATAHEGYRAHAGFRELVDRGGVRTLLHVPLVKDETLLGVITVYRQERDPFSDRQVALMQNFAAQAVIAIENARLMNETRDALERQTATSEVLKVINSSPGNLTPVFDAVLANATRLCDAAFGILWLCDGERFHAAALHGAPHSYAEIARVPQRPLPTNPLGRLLRGERLIVSLDVAAEESYRVGDPVRRALVDLAGARSVVQVALTTDGGFLGSLTVYRREVRAFSDKQIALLQNFAAQAVIAMENARLLTQQREALERQIATTEVLETINRSPGDLQPVFEAILAKAMALCEAAFGTFATFDGQRLNTVATRGVPEALARFRRSNPPEYGPGTGPARLIAGEAYVHDIDAANSDAYRHGDPSRRAIVDLGGARTILNVALRKDERLLGTLSIYRNIVRPFSDNQIALLQGFAAQAVIAMDNARLLGELRQRTADLSESLEYQTATSSVLETIGRSTSDIQPVLDTMLGAALRLCRTESGGIAIQQGQEFRYIATLGWDSEADRAFRNMQIVPGRGTVAGRALAEGRVVQVEDVASDPEFERPDLATLSQWRTALGVPLMQGGRPIGAIAVTRDRVEPFTDRQIALVRTFADQAVIAMENARLLTELRQRTDDLQASLEYQTAIGEVLTTISRSTFDLGQVLQTLSETALRLCEAEMAFIVRREGEQFIVSTAAGATPDSTADAREYQLYQKERPIMPDRGSITGRVAIEKGPVQIADIAADPEYKLAGASALGRIRTQVGVPLIREGALVGVMVLSRQRVEPFTQRQVNLLRTFADQAVIAMENARLIDQLHQRTDALARSVEELEATGDVLKTISRSSTDLKGVLDTLLETVARLCRADQAYMFRRHDQLHHLIAAHGVPPEGEEYIRTHPFKPERGTTSGRVAMEKRAIHIEDVLNDPEYTYSEGQKAAGFRTMLGLPLLREDTLIGVFVLGRTRCEGFSPQEIDLARSFADQAAIAIENARLFEELRDRQAELRVTFDNMGDGVVMFDADLKLAAWNRNFQQLLDVPDDFLASRPGLGDYVRMLVQRGELGDRQPDQEVERYRQRATRKWSTERVRPDGRVLEVRNNPVPGGGAVLIYSDITKRKHAEAEIRQARDVAEAALERQTATADILKVIASSPADTRPAFDAIAQSANNLLDGLSTTVWRLDGDQYHLVAFTPTSPEADAALRAMTPLSKEHGDSIAPSAGNSTIEIADTEAGPPFMRDIARLRGFRACLAASLRIQGESIGFVNVTRREPGAFGSDDVQLLKTFADQAVIAIQNAKLFTELRESLEQQTATSEILQVISQSPTDVKPVLDAVANAALRFCGANDVQVCLREADNWFVAVHLGPLGSKVGERRVLNRETGPGRAITDGKTVHLADVQGLDPVEFAEARKLGTALGFNSALCAPMMRDEVAIGGISLRRPQTGSFSERQIALLESFAAQAVIAIENVRLFTELRGSLERLKAAQANLIQAEKMASLGQLTAGIAHEIKNPLNFVNNFASLSGELLDELKQGMEALLAAPDDDKRAELQDTIDLLTGNLAKILEHGRRADGIVKSMLSHSRGGTGDWQPSNINALVEEALNLAYHGARAQDKDFNVTLERDFTAEPMSIEVVPQDVTRVFLNLFGNGFYATKKRHLEVSDAGYRPTLRVSTRDLGEAVEVRVRDNGTGIQPEVRAKLFQPFFTTKPTGEGTGLGLSISYDIIAQQHGGSIHIESEPGAFTEFTVRLPRRRRAA